jgi:hypothetical protein
MARAKDTPARRTWEDWASLALGIGIALGPWIVDETGNRAVVASAAVSGLAVMLLAELDLVSSRRWVEMAQLVVGLWVALSSFVLATAPGGQLRVWQIVAGAAVVLLAILELRKSAAA